MAIAYGKMHNRMLSAWDRVVYFYERGITSKPDNYEALKRLPRYQFGSGNQPMMYRDEFKSEDHKKLLDNLYKKYPELMLVGHTSIQEKMKNGQLRTANAATNFIYMQIQLMKKGFSE